MAGPGGGPPRKSHTKSRKGCRTCKKRHIRCDETFPQCRNCTKHNCRCDYMDMQNAGEEPLKGSQPPDLLMSSELQQKLDNWRITGQSPISELQTHDPVYWTRFSTIDLRLIHHIVTLSTDFHNRGYSSCTPWAAKMHTLISVALSHDFVMSALLALSASHLAWQTKNTDTDNLAYHHRGVALKGLHEALGSFSRENSDAILAASMLLSWQATEWRSWASLQQGVSTVLNAMRPWAQESELARYIEGQRALARSRTSFFNTSHVQTLSDDLRTIDSINTAIHNLRLRLGNNADLAEHSSELLDYLQKLQQDMPIQSPEKAFERLQPLRSMLFWLPPAVLRPGESDLAAMCLLAHFYATALALEPLFPDISGAYLGGLVALPLDRIYEIMRNRRNTAPQDTGLQVAMQLLEVPMQIATTYKARPRKASQPVDGYRVSPQASPFISPHLPLSSPAEIVGIPLYSHSPMASPPMTMAPSSYFPQISLAAGLQEPSSMRLRGIAERSLSAGTLQAPQHPIFSQPMPRSSHDISMSADYFSHSAYQPFGGHLGSRFVSPSELWA